METMTKPALQATDRLRQTVAALARLLDQTMNDIHSLDSEFQERVAQVIQQADVRMTEEMRARFNQQIATAVEAVRNEAAGDREALIQELDRLKHSASEWQNERAQLAADYQRANDLLEQTRNELDRSRTETDEAAAIALERQIATAVEGVRAELSRRWANERAALVAERDQAAEALARVERTAAYEWEKKMAAAKEQWEAERTQLIADHERALTAAAEAAVSLPSPSEEKSSIDIDGLRAEFNRVATLIQEISRVIENPETELSVVIRMNAERAELESYLRGIRFALPKE
jgi:chromosome segregation ATPase